MVHQGQGAVGGRRSNGPLKAVSVGWVRISGLVH